MLPARQRELEVLGTRLDEAGAGHGGMTIVCGESGAGKTTSVELVMQRWPERMWWAACDPISTPRPLGPIHDLAGSFSDRIRTGLRRGDHPYETFEMIFDEFSSQATALVVDDLQWADQATVDLLRYILRRIQRTRSYVIGIVRDDEVPLTHPMRSLLGDVAHATHATALTLHPLSVESVIELVGDRPVDPVQLHRITGGNAFYVFEMLDHQDADLPTSVRNSILSRTAGFGAAAWDLLHLLACAPGPIPVDLLPHLGVEQPAIDALWEGKFIRRGERGIQFRHDLCRLAVAGVIPPTDEADVHRRFIAANRIAAQNDPSVLTHHALGAGDAQLISQAATEAGDVAARSGAHTQAGEFYEIALNHGRPTPSEKAELNERLADELLLTSRLPDAIAARGRALRLRDELGDRTAVGANHHALAMYKSQGDDLATAEHHVAQAVTLLDISFAPRSATNRTLLGQALATQAYFALLTSELPRAAELLEKARECADMVDDPATSARVTMLEGYREGLAGIEGARSKLAASITTAAELREDELYANGCTSLAYLDIEGRRLGQANEVLATSIPLSAERDVPLALSWLMGMRSRLELLLGNWDAATATADAAVAGPPLPLAHTLPLVVRALIATRRGAGPDGGIDQAWRVLSSFGEHLQVFAAAAIVERAWLTGREEHRMDACRALLDSPSVRGLPMATGELAVWLHRMDPGSGVDSAAGPYRLLLAGDCAGAAEEFTKLSMPYDAALAMVDTGEPVLIRRGLDDFDRLGATAVAAKVRGDLRARGIAVPAPRRASTRKNPSGLTSRELEVLRLLETGSTYAELANEIHLSVKTVDKHVSSIIAKLAAGNRRDAVRRARELGIL